MIDIYEGDCLDVLRGMPDASVDAIVTDPPYGLNGKPPPLAEVLRAWLAGEVYRPRGKGFMGREWDAYVPGPEVWRECLRVLKPGGHLLAFYGTRTYHLGATAIELAGFEPRDMVSWLYGSGFPKSLDVSKAIDKAAGAKREVVGQNPNCWSPKSNVYGGGKGVQATGIDKNITAPATPEAAQWAGWGTALKPAQEKVCAATKPLDLGPISASESLVARKPLVGTVAANVLAHGTGAINVDGCRIGDGEDQTSGGATGKWLCRPCHIREHVDERGSWGGRPFALSTAPRPAARSGAPGSGSGSRATPTPQSSPWTS